MAIRAVLTSRHAEIYRDSRTLWEATLRVHPESLIAHNSLGKWFIDKGQWIEAREQCREHLRAGRDFAFNATNITRQIRQRWIELFADYVAYIEIVYLEPPVGTILAQNRQRVKSVPEKVMLRLLERLEPPTVTECHSLILE